MEQCGALDMRTVRALSLTLLLIMTSLSLMISPSSAVDTSLNSDTTWSGDIVLTGNVTVLPDTTLTLQPGTTVDGGDGHWIHVEGTLFAEHSEFFSSHAPLTQGSHGAGLWTGLQISQTGHAILDNTTINNSKTGIKVDGSLTATTLSINDAYIGMNIIGSATVDDLHAEHIDYDVIRNSGTLNLFSGVFTDVAGGIWSTGTSVVEGMTVSNVGTALRSSGGSLTANGLNFHQATVGLSSSEGASTDISDISGDNISLFIDASNSDDLTVENAAISGTRLLVGNGVQSFSLQDIDFHHTATSSLAAVDLRCTGACDWTNLSIVNATSGLILSGQGSHSLVDSSIQVLQRAIEATGYGHLTLDAVQISAGISGVDLRDVDSALSDVNVTMTSSDSTAFSLLDGTHQWSGVSAEKPYSSQDTSSLGLQAWYAHLDAQGFSLLNYGNGIQANNAVLEGSTFSVRDGKGTGISLTDSSLLVDTLNTKVYPDAVVLESNSELHVSNWVAATHGTPLSVSSSSSAIIRDFQPLNTPLGSSDALGDGTLLYGGSSSAVISVSSSNYLEETPVTFTDLTGNPIQATITVHGFILQSDENGAADLPLLNQGSPVEVTLAGAGVVVTLFGSTIGQSVQVPVIPVGDWTIPTGDFVILGPRPDGTPHALSGNLTMETGSGIELLETSLVLPSFGKIEVQGSAQFIGDDAYVFANSISMGLSSVLSGSENGDGLIVDANVTWACQSTREIFNIDVVGTFTLQPGCEVSVLDGKFQGVVTAYTGAQLTVFSSLTVSVIDKGSPVEGALISIGGAISTTGQTGTVSTTATARYVDDSSQTFGGIQTVNLNVGSFNDFITWDSTESFHHTFMASTLDAGLLDQWLILEAQWSPYYLDGDLTVGAMGTLTIDDGVSLRISESNTISVNGKLDAGAATFSSTGSGARWGGFILGNLPSSLIDLSQSNVFEASPALYAQGFGHFMADGVNFARSSGADSLVMIESNSNTNLTIKNSHFYDAGNGCIKAFPASSTLLLENVRFESCNGPAVWARQLKVEMNDVHIGPNISTGFELTAVSGNLSNVDAVQFDGEGNIVYLESIDGDFTVSNLNGTVGQSAGISGMNNRYIQLDSIQLTGSPALDFDNSAGHLSEISLVGQGTGTGLISHHGRALDSLVVDNFEAFSYSVAIDLHADGPTGNAAPLIVRNPDILSPVVLSAENYPARIEGGSMIGQIAGAGPIFIDLIDGEASASSMYDGAQLRMWRTFSFDARLNGVARDVDFSISTDGLTPSYSTTARGNSVLVEIPIAVFGNETESTAESLTVSTSSIGLPDTTTLLALNASTPNHLIIALVDNIAPSVSITEPYSGQRVMESVHLRASAEYSDDLDSVGNLTLVWIVSDATGVEVMRGPDEPVYNITDLQHGLYVLELQVTDTLGAVSSSAVDFEVTELDSDGDWTSTCLVSSVTGIWFDATIGFSCGPDTQDGDDDNDGHSDSRDAWPVDPCAWLDSDGDGQPDSLNCPDGVTTYLTADSDDDGDGIPDSAEGGSVEQSGDFSTTTLLLLSLLVVGAILSFIRLRRGGGNIGEVDNRHL